MRLTMRAGYLMYRWKGDDIHSITPTSMPLRETRMRPQHTPAAAPLALLHRNWGVRTSFR